MNFAKQVTHHFPLFTGQYDGAVGLLQPAAVSCGQVVQTPVNILAHGHDVIKIFLRGQGELKTCLRQGFWKLGHSQAGINLHLQKTDEI